MPYFNEKRRINADGNVKHMCCYSLFVLLFIMSFLFVLENFFPKSNTSEIRTWDAIKTF